MNVTTLVHAENEPEALISISGGSGGNRISECDPYWVLQIGEPSDVVHVFLSRAQVEKLASAASAAHSAIEMTEEG